jgi:hypothetical protein
VPYVAPQVLSQSLSAVQEGAHVLGTAASFGGVVGTGFGAEASVVVPVPESTMSSTGVSEPAQANSNAPAANAEATAKSAAGEGRRPVAEEFEEEDFTVRMDYSRKRASTTFRPQINY